MAWNVSLRPVFRGWLSALLVGMGLFLGAFDALVVRPTMISFAKTGRRVTGVALASRGAVESPNPRPGTSAPRSSGGTVGVADPELGWQVVDTSGEDDVGTSVALLCSTPQRRCERLARVSAYVQHWPFTASMARAGALLALAGAAVFATRSRPSAPS